MTITDPLATGRTRSDEAHGTVSHGMPTHVQVGPHRYSVDTSVAALHEARNTESNGTLVGHHNAERCRLTVDASLAPSQQADTLLHEVLHAALMATAADRQLTRRKPGLDEYVVASLTPILLDVLQRNPNLVAYLAAPAGDEP